MITLTLTLRKLETRNRPLWKFDNSLLKDTIFVNEINDVVENVIEEYAVLPYSREQLPVISKWNVQFVVPDLFFFDLLLMKIRSKINRMLR